MLAGCGGASKPALALKAPCTLAARAALAHQLGVRPSSVTAARSVSNTASLQCVYRARIAGKPVTVTVLDYTGPSPYFIAERTEVEDSQVFGPTATHPPPLAVTGVGLMANWFFDLDNFQATDGHRLITVTVVWDHKRQSVQRAIAVAVTRPYMHPPVGEKAINQLVYGYPSG